MKILYAIQGTGNGHISRAREIVPLLQQHGEVDLLVSGTQVDLSLNQELAFRLHGFSFIFGKKGGVDHYGTWKSMNLPRFFSDARQLPLNNYNLILNDFEPVTAWACKLRGIESVGLSHQASFQSGSVPIPKSFNWAQLVMKYYAPSTHYIGFHFKAYDDFIHTPVIRSEIRNMVVSDLGHYTVYLPAVADELLLPVLKQMPQIKWEVFSKRAKVGFRDANVMVLPVDNAKFNTSLASCSGLFTGGGFEGPSEALFLGKKLMVMPMKYQYEQKCNAYALQQMGIPVIWESEKNWVPKLTNWVSAPQVHDFHFPDQTAQVIEKVVKQFAR